MIDVIELAEPDPNRINVEGIVRVSADHDGYSPGEQLDGLRKACERQGKNLVRVRRELDVSGARPLSKRPGLRAAVESVESGEIQEILAVYFDRLFRSLKTQAEALERVERHGGKIGSVDFGQISEGTVAQWLSSQQVGMIAEYHSRSTRERTEPTRVRMVEAGQLPWPKPPLGILLNDDRTLTIDENMRELMALVFATRAAGESKQAIKRLLAEHGHHVTIRGVEAILGQALYMGELRFGERVNRAPFGDVEPIVDKRTWEAVQKMRTPRGRTTSSDRLLARLGVLHCAACGSRMVAGGAWVSYTTASGEIKRTRYAFYKCGMFQECAAPSSISAENVERYVSELTKSILFDAEERESALREAAQARRSANVAIDAHRRARRRLAVDGEISDDDASEILAELERERDELIALANELEHESELVEAINAARDWDRLSTTAKRSLIRLALERVDVARGRGVVESRCTPLPRRRDAQRKQSTSLAA